MQWTENLGLFYLSIIEKRLIYSLPLLPSGPAIQCKLGLLIKIRGQYPMAFSRKKPDFQCPLNLVLSTSPYFLRSKIILENVRGAPGRLRRIKSNRPKRAFYHFGGDYVYSTHTTKRHLQCAS